MPLPFTVRRTDPDAAAFCARSGASDRAAVSAFVRGVKDLGLWENMVCWPLRSEQNAGTGTTAYSLGGLGTFDGTLAGGPAWSADGLTFDGSDDRVTTGVVPITGAAARTLMTVSNSSTGSLNIIATLEPPPLPTAGETWGILHFPNNTTLTGWAFNDDSTIGSVTSGAFSSAAFGYGTSRFGFINGATQTLSGSTNAPNTKANSSLTIGRRGSTWHYNGTIAFVALFNTATNTNIHNLYRATLGTGLGLP
jgi:hypothetical protein